MQPVNTCPLIVLLFLVAALPVAAQDVDRDGVVDSVDQCPATAAGAPVTMRGCDHDSDRDSIPDYRDHCLDSDGGDVDPWGCPTAIEIELTGLSFEVNAATLTDSEHILERAAKTLLAIDDLQAEVAGHTDNRGSSAHNRILSRQRAEAVRNWLINAGVEPQRLVARGYGESRPVADNNDEQGRAANRRVVLRIFAGTLGEDQ